MSTAPVEQYDLIVIGGGMSGLPFAQKAALKGRKTALVEKELLLALPLQGRTRA